MPASMIARLDHAPLTAGILLGLGLIGSASASTPAPQANTIVVQNCNDNGSGSLRAAVAAPASGDIIDLTQLACTRITLTTGQITVPLTSLTLNGPGPDQLSIDGDSGGNHFNRVFDHQGSGSFALNHLTITNAKYRSATIARGGCIRSSGTVGLYDSTVTSCVVQSQSNIRASGGGIFSSGLTLLHSKVSGNVSDGGGNGAALGGGAYVVGDATVKYSTISNNTAADGIQVNVGGLFASSGDVYLRSSTVSGNYSSSVFGGVYVTDADGSHTLRIFDSTISGNHSAYGGAGVVSHVGTTIANSTIAFNSDTKFSGFGPGLVFRPTYGGSLTLHSSIVANNYGPAGDFDTDIPGATTVGGSNNLILAHTGPIPAGTLSGCPLLGPLGNQGGETQTHRLLIGSPAIDAGSNPQNLTLDQRGTGFPRVHGAQADIGAFEDQGVKPNVIFIGGFEGRCR